ncbi:DNA topoisomerase 2, partial [Aduncisulcus paluster]
MPQPRKKLEYEKKSLSEHILLRPDTYIGSIEPSTEMQFVMDSSWNLIRKSVTIVPGLLKIFDEILVNASDNKQRDPNMGKIEVEINEEEGYITVKNDGRGVPVEIHEVEGIYTPELVFGHLLTGNNFDDTAEKVVGGRNGYGAKLTNLFS